jgi:hypothetical protein
MGQAAHVLWFLPLCKDTNPILGPHPHKHHLDLGTPKCTTSWHHHIRGWGFNTWMGRGGTQMSRHVHNMASVVTSGCESVGTDLATEKPKHVDQVNIRLLRLNLTLKLHWHEFFLLTTKTFYFTQPKAVMHSQVHVSLPISRKVRFYRNFKISPTLILNEMA